MYLTILKICFLELRIFKMGAKIFFFAKAVKVALYVIVSSLEPKNVFCK